MPRSRQLTEGKLSSIFGGSLSYNGESGPLTPPHLSVSYIVWFQFVIYGNPVCVCTQMSLHLDMFLVLSHWFSSHCLFVLSYSNFFIFASFYFILPLFLRCLLSKQRQKRCGSEWKGRWVGNRRSRERDNDNQNILCGKKNYFQ